MIDKEIINQVKRNDRKAQEQLYATYKTTWFMICLRYHKNRADALDALQNALVNIYTKINQFNGEKGSFKAWSSRIVINENLMLLRKKVASFEVQNLPEGFEMKDQQETPLDKLSAKELTTLIQKLPDGYRTVFNLYVMEGKSHAEIATLLNINEGTSKSQLSKARKFLQQRIELSLFVD